MRHLSAKGLARFFVLVALAPFGASYAQPHHVQTEVVLAGLEIESIDPPAPVAGAAVTINYQVHATVFVKGAITGIVSGEFMGALLTAPGGTTPQSVAVQSGQTIEGQLVIPVAAVGSGDITLNFSGPLVCKGPPQFGRPPSCTRTVFATAAQTLTIVQPTVTVRIAGSSFAKLSFKDSRDHSSVNSGFLCVTHNPGCGWWGNSSTDTFFDVKQLPAGASLANPPEFVQFWPLGLNSPDAGGNGLTTGTYGVAMNSSVPGHPTVHWENTCWSTFGGKDLDYSVSFLVTMPKGTDLGEPTFDPAEQQSPCLPAGFSPVPQIIQSGISSPVPLFLSITQGTWYEGTFGAGASGRLLTINNGEGFEVDLIADANMPGGCGKPGNKPLQQHETINAADFYHTAVNYPKTIGACIPNSLAGRQEVQLVVTYSPN